MAKKVRIEDLFQYTPITEDDLEYLLEITPDEDDCCEEAGLIIEKLEREKGECNWVIVKELLRENAELKERIANCEKVKR